MRSASKSQVSRLGAIVAVCKREPERVLPSMSMFCSRTLSQPSGKPVTVIATGGLLVFEDDEDDDDEREKARDREAGEDGQIAVSHDFGRTTS